MTSSGSRTPDALEERPRLCPVECELTDCHRMHTAMCSHPTERPASGSVREIRTTCEPAGTLSTSVCIRCQFDSAPKPVCVVDHQHEWSAARTHGAPPGGEHHAAEVDGDGRQPLPGAGFERFELVEEPDQICEEDDGIVVLGRCCQPGGRPLVVA